MWSGSLSDHSMAAAFTALWDSTIQFTGPAPNPHSSF